MTLRRPVLLLLLAACGPGPQDTDSDTGTSDTGSSVSMSSNPSDPSAPTSLDPTGPNPTSATSATTATTVPPDPTTTTATTVPPDPTVSTVTTVQPTTFTTTEPTFTASDTDSSDPSNSVTTFPPPPPDTTIFPETSDSESVFIFPVDIPFPGECDVFLENCPDGSKCMPFAANNSNTWDSTKCVPIMFDPAQVGDVCFVEESGVSGIDNCDFHAMCFFVEPDTLQGTCVGMCTGSPQNPVCPPDSHCILANDGVLALCLPTCDPLDISSCPPDQVCVFNADAFLCVGDVSGSDGDFPDECEFINECDPGFACIDPALVPACGPQQIGCCSPFCDLDQANLCPPGLSCLPWFEEGQAPPGLEDVGVCAEA